MIATWIDGCIIGLTADPIAQISQIAQIAQALPAMPGPEAADSSWVAAITAVPLAATSDMRRQTRWSLPRS